MIGNKVVFVLAITGAIIITNAGQFVLQKYDKDSIRSQLQSQLKIANKTIEEIGNLTDCYTVSSDVKAGDEVTKHSLDILPMPDKYINELYVLSESDAVGKFFKVDVHPGTPLTQDFLMSEAVDDTLREQDLYLDNWPLGTKVGDYIDIRLTLPKGEDYIVLSHKRVYDINGSTVKIKINERERHFLGASLIDKFINSSYGATMYGAKYTDPGLQKPAIVYYNIPDNIMTVIANNPNIIDKVLDTSISRNIIEGQMKIDQKVGSVLGTGRSSYQAKLDQARDFFEQQGKKGASAGKTDSTDSEQIPNDDTSTSKSTDSSTSKASTNTTSKPETQTTKTSDTKTAGTATTGTNSKSTAPTQSAKSTTDSTSASNKKE